MINFEKRERSRNVREHNIFLGLYEEQHDKSTRELFSCYLRFDNSNRVKVNQPSPSDCQRLFCLLFKQYVPGFQPSGGAGFTSISEMSKNYVLI